MNVNEIIRILSDIRSKYNCFDAEDEECYRGLSEAIKMLSAQQWIPCSERLPEEGKDVLCCFYNGEHYRIIVSHRTDFNFWSGVGRTGDLIAWMPLPEPAKLES